MSRAGRPAQERLSRRPDQSRLCMSNGVLIVRPVINHHHHHHHHGAEPSTLAAALAAAHLQRAKCSRQISSSNHACGSAAAPSAPSGPKPRWAGPALTAGPSHVRAGVAAWKHSEWPLHALFFSSAAASPAFVAAGESVKMFCGARARGGC